MEIEFPMCLDDNVIKQLAIDIFVNFSGKDVTFDNLKIDKNLCYVNEGDILHDNTWIHFVINLTSYGETIVRLSPIVIFECYRRIQFAANCSVSMGGIIANGRARMIEELHKNMGVKI
jgi:hypothetical protein